jgi:hypothetical protein
MRYTDIYEVYKVIDTNRNQQVLKDPKLVIELDYNSNSDSDNQDSETEMTESSKPTNKSTTETGLSELAKQMFSIAKSTKPVKETTMKLAPIK